MSRMLSGASSLPEGVHSSRTLPQEVPVALSFNGTAQAVMMASPSDLEDFAYGFAISEGIARPDEIVELTVVEGQKGIDVQCWLSDPARERLTARRRSMIGPVGCGLCGLDSIEEALRPLPAVPQGQLQMSAAEVLAAIEALPQHQPLHDLTHATHCAGYWRRGHGIWAAREDVGRHNALDKLIGHLVRNETPCPEGAVLLTSRVSIDLVQKVAALGAPILIAVSAPTADAVTLAAELNLTLIALARGGRFEIFSGAERLCPPPRM